MTDNVGVLCLPVGVFRACSDSTTLAGAKWAYPTLDDASVIAKDALMLVS